MVIYLIKLRTVKNKHLILIMVKKKKMSIHRSCYVHQHLHRDFIKNVLLFYHLPTLKRHYLLLARLYICIKHFSSENSYFFIHFEVLYCT